MNRTSQARHGVAPLYAPGDARNRSKSLKWGTSTSSRVVVLSCDEQTTHFFAELKLQLKRQGTPIPLNAVWIAALALQHRYTLFTRDSDFANIPQLARV